MMKHFVAPVIFICLMMIFIGYYHSKENQKVDCTKQIDEAMKINDQDWLDATGPMVDFAKKCYEDNLKMQQSIQICSKLQSL